MDVPKANGVKWADARHSEIAALQFVGRAMRTFEGKTHCKAMVDVLLEKDALPEYLQQVDNRRAELERSRLPQTPKKCKYKERVWEGITKPSSDLVRNKTLDSN